MTGVEHDLILEALRVLFLVGFPLAIVAAAVGTLIAALQAATTIHDPALGYAARLLAVVVVLYLFTPTAVRLIVSLAEMSLQ